MKKILLRIALCCLAMLLCHAGQAQNETPPIDYFQLEIDSVDRWYTSAKDSYQFDMTGIHRTFGDPIYGADSFYVVPGEDILDNQMLSDLLNKIGYMAPGTNYTANETSSFTYPFGTATATFTKNSQYTCTLKPCASVTMDGDVLTSTALYQVRELSAIQSSMGPSWRRTVDYYAVPDASNQIISCLSYWRERLMFQADMKFMQNARSYKPGPVNDAAISIAAGPIPANQSVTVTVRANESMDFTRIELLSMQARTILYVNIGKMAKGSIETRQLDISGVQPGQYVLRVTSDVGRAFRKLTIIR